MELIILIIIIVVVISNNKKKTAQSSKKQHSSYKKSTTYSYENKNVSAVNNNAAQARKKSYGNEKVGERLVIGDAVPRGMIEADCPYCGAENLIQPRDRGNCVCYFCRTKL